MRIYEGGRVGAQCILGIEGAWDGVEADGAQL